MKPENFGGKLKNNYIIRFDLNKNNFVFKLDYIRYPTTMGFGY